MELLVVISIIGILAAIVMSSLNVVRTKGVDGAAKSAMGQLRAQAEIYFDTYHDYGVFTIDCAGNDMFNSLAHIFANINTRIKPGTLACEANGNAWAVSATLQGGPIWCVDSKGLSASTTRSGTTCN